MCISYYLGHHIHANIVTRQHFAAAMRRSITSKFQSFRGSLVCFGAMQATVLIALLVVASLSLCLARKSVLVCPNLTGEPTISDIMTNLIPNDAVFPAEIVSRLHNQGYNISSLLSSVDTALKFSFPLTSLFSDGQFTVDYAAAGNLYTFNDIRFVYKRHPALDLICAGNYNGYLGFLCDCDDMSGLDAAVPSGCVKSALCSDKTVAAGQCILPWNPFQDGCLMIDINSDSSADNDALIQRSVEYRRVVPTLYDIWRSLAGADADSRSYTKHNAFFAPDHPIAKLQHAVETHVIPALRYVPLYAVNLVLGYIVVSNARDLADSPIVQVLMQGVYGLLLAFIVLAYILYRMSKRVVGRYGGPLAELAHIPISFSILSVTLANPAILRTLQRAVWAFWHTGYPFGVAWAGKAYFMGCVALCLGVCKYFAFFQAESATWHVMHYSIKLAGLALLAHGTSCTPLAAALVLLGCFEDNIRHWLWLMYLSSNAMATKPTYKYLAQKKMTMAEAEQLGRNYTKIALEGLRNHLNENPEQLDLVMDKFREGGKKEEAQLVGRFAQGSYLGVPYTVAEEDVEGSKSSWVGGLLRAVGVLVVVVGVLLGGAVVAAKMQEER